jgi:hypothetical protein
MIFQIGFSNLMLSEEVARLRTGLLKDVIVSVCHLLMEFPEQMLRRFTDFAVRTVGILLTMGEKYFKPIG